MCRLLLLGVFQTPTISIGSRVPADDSSLASLAPDGSYPVTPIGRLARKTPPVESTPSGTANGSFTKSPPLSTPPKSKATPQANGANGSSGFLGASVLLSRDGYYTKPPMDRLDAMAAQAGRVVVQDFVVGHKQLGCIRFPGSTDVTGLDLDSIGKLGICMCLTAG